ncbi:MAG TPA: TorF family putative porin [Paucimonas sp.]|nr:TorF family putative porin [Paucimonas sp.]
MTIDHLAPKGARRIAPLAFGCLLLASAPSHAQNTAPANAPAPAWTHAGNVSLVSDYLFRGVSQTQGKPTVQATIDFTHASGAYLGIFGSGVSHAAYNNGNGAEIDLYGGYRHSLSADANVDVGVVTYWYPGARYNAAGREVTYHTQDFKIGINKGSFNAYAWYTFSKHWFGFAVDPASGGFAKSRGTTYFEANWNPEISPGLVLNLHAGRQNVRNFSAFDFYDLKLGVTKTWDSWTISAAAIHNNGDAERNGLPYWTFFNADGSSKKVVGTRLLLTAARNF